MNNPKVFRASWHDYRSRCIYMITLSKRAGVGNFSVIEGDCHLPPGTPGGAVASLSPVGREIRKEIMRIPLLDSAIKVLQYVVMPDHVHILLFVMHPTEHHLGNTVARFKVAVNNRCGLGEVFSPGFNDQILNHGRSLDVLFRYLRDNPRRLAARRAHPEFFRRVNGLTVGGRSCRAYGNLLLLRNPFREQVVVHRADTPATREHNRCRWLHTAANGGVLVSPFISPAEKAIRAEATEAGGRVILVTNEPMPDRFKPSGRDFPLCEAGKLLIVSADFPGELTREACVAMNTLAAELAAVEIRK